jgi:hypothetical protein
MRAGSQSALFSGSSSTATTSNANENIEKPDKHVKSTQKYERLINKMVAAEWDMEPRLAMVGIGH